MDIIQKIKKSNLVGRGGGCYPVAAKWDSVKKSAGEKKYVVCNGSEGEPGVKKDDYILANFSNKLIDGMRLALEFLKDNGRVEVFGYIYLNDEFYKKYSKTLNEKIASLNLPISLFCKPHIGGYIGGEETSLLNAIEGKRIEPRLRPPYPNSNGLWGCPTLINNVETFYNVNLVNDGNFENKRFYTIEGDSLWTGVFELPDDLSIEQVLKQTKNYPDFPFFVQVGGEGSGVVLNSTQLNMPASGCASITIYCIQKHQPIDVLKKWINFFASESCGQCVPCREGTYRLKEIFDSGKINWTLVSELLSNLSDASFCGLGCAVPIPIASFIKNVAPMYGDKSLSLPEENRKMICQCFG
jgi:NADH:ubiquinone oxidoreductase subunit F (NADH-binding)